MRDASTLARRRARDIGAYWLLMFCMATVGGFASYAAACNTSGFVDAALAHGDRLLHFDWVACYEFVARRPLLQQLGAGVYGSVFVSPLAMLGVMAWRGEQRRRTASSLPSFWARRSRWCCFRCFPGAARWNICGTAPSPICPPTGFIRASCCPNCAATPSTLFR
jgi:hypothetical protein